MSSENASNQFRIEPSCMKHGTALPCVRCAVSAAQHTPGPHDIYAQATAFTETIERFLRADDDRVPPTESEVAEALYALRAAIAKAEGSAP